MFFLLDIKLIHNKEVEGQTSISSLYSARSLFEFLTKFYGHSKQQLKKQKINKKYLEKEVRKGDVLTLPLNLLNDKVIFPLYTGAFVEILEEKNDYLVVSKPHNIHSHPLSYLDSSNLLSNLRHRGKREALFVNEKQWDRGLLYRLDYETSGVMIIAKEESFYKEVREAFSNRAKKKYYLCLVPIGCPEGLIEHYLSTSGIKIQEDLNGKKAELSIQKVYEEKDYSLLLIELKTGLRHQIRVQLSLLGFPIYGDTLYGGKEAERLFLHAFSYEVEGRDGKVIKGTDPSLSLFSSLLDLDSALEVLSNQGFTFKR